MPSLSIRYRTLTHIDSIVFACMKHGKYSIHGKTAGPNKMPSCLWVRQPFLYWAEDESRAMVVCECKVHAEGARYRFSIQHPIDLLNGFVCSALGANHFVRYMFVPGAIYNKQCVVSVYIPLLMTTWVSRSYWWSVCCGCLLLYFRWQKHRNPCSTTYNRTLASRSIHTGVPHWRKNEKNERDREKAANIRIASHILYNIPTYVRTSAE